MDMIKKENNQEFKFMSSLSMDYIDAYIFVHSYIQYGMPLFNFFYELTELAYKNKYGIRYFRLYGNISKEEKIESDEEFFNLIDDLKNYLLDEERTDDYNYVVDLMESGCY